MANTRLLFYGSERGNTENHKLEVYANLSNEIFIEVDANDGLHNCFITIDKSTAIKLSKELRRQIALLNDEEV